MRLAPLAVAVALAGCSSDDDEVSIPDYDQPVVESRINPLLEVDGYQFRDLNGDGVLNPYEDWRLPVDRRVEDLLARMTLEEKVGMMLISSKFMGRDKLGNADGRMMEGEDIYIPFNMFNPSEPLIKPMLVFSPATKGIQERHLRRFIARDNESAYISAVWANNIQETSEDTRLGIPSLIASNPRNHLVTDAGIGVSVGETAFSSWPGELGLAAAVLGMNDENAELVKEFGEIAAHEWTATGVHKGYQYMADIATDPRWERVEGTFGEDPELAATLIRAITEGFQGENLGKHSVALTTKHFPGGGPQVDGQDPHFSWGTDQHYPGGMFEEHLIPFEAAIEAGTASMMPYYAVPKNDTSDVEIDFEEVAFAYNKYILTDLLRDELGFEGIINSDTGPIFMMPWGMEDADISERYQKALEAGVDLFSGHADPVDLLEVVTSGMVSEERIDESIRRLLKEKFELGIFENPYVDPDYARDVVGNNEYQAKGDLAQRQSLVLLENDKSILPLKEGSKVFFEKIFSDETCPADPITATGGMDFTRTLMPASEEVRKANLAKQAVAMGDGNTDITYVDSRDEASVHVMVVIPNNCGLFASDGQPISLKLSDNNVDVDYVNQIAGDEKDSVIITNFSSPWAMEEIHTDNLHTVMATFGASDQAIKDVLEGTFSVTGKMPISIPLTQADAEENVSDIPGYRDPNMETRWKFGDGLSYE